MENLFRMSQQNKILCISFGVFLILYFFINKKTEQAEKKPITPEVKSADTFIPAGFVLVPIQIDNGQNLTGFMDAFGLVDLYASSETGDNILIADKIKLIRAPLNPNQFAVLATEHQAKLIMQIKTPFWVVLQNRNSVSANLEKNTLNLNDKSDGKLVEKKTGNIAGELSNKSDSTNSTQRSSQSIKKKTSQRARFTIEYHDKTRL